MSVTPFPFLTLDMTDHFCLYSLFQASDRVMIMMKPTKKVRLEGPPGIVDDPNNTTNRLTKLTSLRMKSCRRVSDRSIALLLAELHSLRELNLSYMQQITDGAIMSLINVKQLRSLDLKSCGVTDASLHHLVAAAASIKILHLDHCRQLTDSAMVSVGKLSNLTSLSLWGCHNL